MFDLVRARPDLEREVDKLGGADLVVVDTSAAYFPGDDENNNPQMIRHARACRDLVTLPGGPCVVVLCHPVKNASEPSQLLPRGGGAFLAEVDGNLTLWQQDGLSELYWHGKFRGPGFEPIMFSMEKIKSQKLIDAKGRLISTVRALPVTEAEQESVTKRSRSDEDRLLISLMINPGASFAKLAESCGWTSDKGTPAKSKVRRLLDRLCDAGLVDNQRNEWNLTKPGKEAAEKASRSMPVDGFPA